MAVSLLPRWLLLAFSLALVACGGGGSSSPQITELSGFVVNGVLVGATVTVRSQSGELVAESITNKDGRFDAELSRAEPPFFLEAQGGRLAGEPYVGTLKAWCPKPEKEGPLRCDVTPYTTLLVYLMEQQDIAYGEAVRAVNNVLQLEQDPFIQAMATGAEVPIDRFDLDAARQQIDGGAGLEGWLDDFSAWVLTPDAAPLPAGSPTFVIRLTTGPGGMGAPSEVTLRWGEVATFNLTPDLNFEVVSALGCGGKLSAGNTVYTTAPVKGVGPVSGVCSVNVSFALRRYDVKYVPVRYDPLEGDSCADAVPEDEPEEGAEPESFGIIEGNNEQRIAHGSGSSPVTAVAAEGYTFEEWSDASSDATRIDLNITEDKEFKACFKINEYSVEYFAGANGSIDGDFNQLVKFGDDASTVTAMPDDGFTFLFWSDGFSQAVRTDEVIASDLTLTAFFQALPSQFPWLRSLHNGAMDLFVAGPSEVVVDWVKEADVSYSLYLASDAATRISTLSPLGCAEPPCVIDALDGLSEGEPVYVALKADGELIAWSSTVPRTLGVNGTVLAQEIDAFDNRYVGGDFSRVLLNQAYATALPQVGAGGPLSSHPLAIAEINGEVRAAANDGLGGLFIAGNFSEVGGEPRSGLAHIDASGQITDWSPSLLGHANALVVLNGHVFVGGDFSEAEGESRANLAAFDYSGALLPWGPVTTGPVYAILPVDKVLYIGGDFTAEVNDFTGADNPSDVNPIRNNLAAIDLNGKVRLWGAKTNGPVYALASFQGGIFVGGSFTQITDSSGGFFSARGLGVFAPGSQSEAVLLGIDLKVNGDVYVLASTTERIYVGGDFSQVGSLSRTNVAAFSGVEVDDWAPVLSSPVYAMAAFNNLVYVGGDSTNGVQSLLVFDESGGQENWSPGLEGNVSVLVPYGESIFVGGDFVGLSGSRERHNLAAFGPQGELLDWSPNADGAVRALSQLNDDLYIGGDFVQVAGESRRGLAAVGLKGTALDGQLLDWDPVVDGSVMAMDVESGIFYVGGNFNTASAGGTPRSNLAAFNSSGVLQSWAPQADAPVRAVLATSSLIYTGGEFSEINGTPRSFLAGIDGDGVLSADWTPEANGAVNVLMEWAGDIYAGGEFNTIEATNTIGPETREGLAAFDTDGSLLLWSPSVGGSVLSSVRALAAVAGDIYVGGDFSSANAEPRTNLAAFDSAGALLFWAPEVNAPVHSLQGSVSEVYVGGDFVQAGGAASSWRQRLAIFDLDGLLQPR